MKKRSLTQFRKDMYEYWKSSDAPDEGSFDEWFRDLMSEIKSEGNVQRIGNRTYILD